MVSSVQVTKKRKGFYQPEVLHARAITWSLTRVQIAQRASLSLEVLKKLLIRMPMLLTVTDGGATEIVAQIACFGAR